MKLLFLISAAFLSFSSHTQEELDEYYEEVEVSLEDFKIEAINWCHTETKPIWLECDNDSVVDLDACTESNITNFIQSNLKFPIGMGCFQGTIFISFVIDKEGYFNDIKVLKGYNKAIDTAAVEVVSKLPKFRPGIQRDRPIAVKYTIPIRFKVS